MPEKGLQVVNGNLEKMKKMIKETEQALQGNQKAIEETGVIHSGKNQLWKLDRKSNQRGKVGT